MPKLERLFRFNVRSSDPRTRFPVLLVTYETINLAVLPSGRAILLAVMVLIVFYIGRSLWIARHDWRNCGTDTKILYLLVAPILTFAVDLLELTDRLFWSRREEKPRRRSNGTATARAG